MKSRNFRELFDAKQAERKFVCVGLDSEFEKIPAKIKEDIQEEARLGQVTDLMRSTQAMVTFNNFIVKATADLVCAYKPNAAFYEAKGIDGIWALKETIDSIHLWAPDVPVILDAKRADIGNTNRGYIEFAFEYLGVDAITVHPYLGREAMQPFLDCKDKGIFVLCKTSNTGSGEFQDLRIKTFLATESLYDTVALQVATEWNANHNCGLVVGATYPDDLARVRRNVGDIPLLIPGIGAQGGDLEATVRAGKDSRGRGMIINSSRGIIFADDPRAEIEALHHQITSCLNT